MSIFSFSNISQAAEPLQVGAPAPVVSASNQDGQTVSLADVYAKGVTLVYFYPKSDTPGCTAQACNIRDSFEELQKQGVQVVGVSTDSVESHKKFQEKYHLPFVLLADTDKAVATAFGVPISEKGFASRQSFLVKDGKIVWRDLKASPKQQSADVLAALKTL